MHHWALSSSGLAGGSKPCPFRDPGSLPGHWSALQWVPDLQPLCPGFGWWPQSPWGTLLPARASGGTSWRQRAIPPAPSGTNSGASPGRGRQLQARPGGKSTREGQLSTLRPRPSPVYGQVLLRAQVQHHHPSSTSRAGTSQGRGSQRLGGHDAGLVGTAFASHPQRRGPGRCVPGPRHSTSAAAQGAGRRRHPSTSSPESRLPSGPVRTSPGDTPDVTREDGDPVPVCLMAIHLGCSPAGTHRPPEFHVLNQLGLGKGNWGGAAQQGLASQSWVRGIQGERVGLGSGVGRKAGPGGVRAMGSEQGGRVGLQGRGRLG